jgi:hypothetical protein
MTTALPKSTANLAKNAGTETELTTLLTPVRRESRRDEVRSVEYTAFPRVRGEQLPRLGFTRDISPLGMCLGVDSPEAIGSLFRVQVRHLDGQPMGTTIARVVWRMASRDGRYWLGLDLLCEAEGRGLRWLPQNTESGEI